MTVTEKFVFNIVRAEVSVEINGRPYFHWKIARENLTEKKIQHIVLAFIKCLSKQVGDLSRG